MMIKENELRIGDLLLDPNGNVCEFSWEMIKGETEFSATECNPIPLTEEWLRKFGFVDGELNKIKLIRINQDYFVCFVNRSRSIDVDVKFVHQLQNLYFALAGEELTLNSETDIPSVTGTQ